MFIMLDMVLDWNNVEKRTHELTLLFLKTHKKIKEENPEKIEELCIDFFRKSRKN